jgi:hypothetical protein
MPPRKDRGSIVTNEQHYVNQPPSGSPTDLRHGAVLAQAYSLLRAIAARGQPERDAADDSAVAADDSGADVARREGRATA